jgi:peptidoglycan/LPS O-acetylase OafA/YrhL
VFARLVMLIPALLVVIGAVALRSDERAAEMLGAAVFALLLFGIHRWDSQLAAWPALQWLAWVGTISYSLYLVHVPLGSRVINLALRRIQHDSPWILLVEVTYWLVSILMAYFFFRLCEQPLEAWRHRLKRRALASAPARLAQN